MEQQTKNKTTLKKCTSCGSNLVFNIEKKCLNCLHCGGTNFINIIPFNKKDNFTPENLTTEEISKNEYSSICNNCGAKVQTTEGNISHTCPFCGSSKIIQNSSLCYEPQAIVLFTVDKNTVKEKFKKWQRKRFFAPTKFKKTNIESEAMAFYTPSWIFDTEVYSKYNGSLTFRYERTYYDSNNKAYTKTEYENRYVRGSRNDKFNNVAISAQRKFSYSFEEISPFDVTNIIQYNEDCLAGFSANHYDIDLKESWDIATKKINRDIENSICKAHGADSVVYLNMDTTYTNCGYAYTLLPMWVCSYEYKQKSYNFYVNGTTGKIYGKSPVSKLKVLLFILFIIALLVSIGFLLIDTNTLGS